MPDGGLWKFETVLGDERNSLLIVLYGSLNDFQRNDHR